MVGGGCSVKEEAPPKLFGDSLELWVLNHKPRNLSAVREGQGSALSVIQKHLNRSQRPAGSEEGRGAETQLRPTSQKSPCSDSGEETAERPWFHGMRSAGNGNKGWALSRVGWSTESLMKRIFKRIQEIRGMRTIARMRL